MKSSFFFKKKQEREKKARQNHFRRRQKKSIASLSCASSFSFFVHSPFASTHAEARLRPVSGRESREKRNIASENAEKERKRKHRIWASEASTIVFVAAVVSTSTSASEKRANMVPKKKPATVAMRSVKGGVFQQQQKKGKGKLAAAAAPAPQPPSRGLGGRTAAASTSKASASAAAAAAPAVVDPAVAAAAERKLRAFDLDGKFGPCVNPTRLERWERAERLGLSPPREVRAILDRFAAGPGFGKKVGVSDKSLWSGRV